MDAIRDGKMEEFILRKLHEYTGHEAVLVQSIFMPPIMLSNIFGFGCILKKRGYTSAPTRRLGGWHLRLLGPGAAFCEKK